MFNNLPFVLTTAFDPSTLVEYPLHPLQVEGALLYLRARLHYLEWPLETRVNYLTQYAVLLKLARSYEEAASAFLLVLAHWQSPELSQYPQKSQRCIATRIRLADTYYLQADFERSNTEFTELLTDSELWPEALKRSYQHFVWQHAGKNAFVQGRVAEAKVYFEKALQFRQQEQLATDLIESSKLAVSRLKKTLH